jgi:nicotinamidase-related amidase
MARNERVAEALIIVDAQTAFVTNETDHEPVPGAEALLERIGELRARAREARALVVQLQNDGAPGAPDEPGTPGWQLGLPAEEGPDEVVVRKSADDGFQGTGLAELLAARGVRRLAICGVMSDMCVAATARGALARGFEVLLPHDAHGTYDVPAAPELDEPPVPARTASRVAEWSLGDQIEIVRRAADVTFTLTAQ